MIATLISASATRWREYLAWLDHWDPECGDAFIMLNAREWLATHQATLSAVDREALANAGARRAPRQGYAVPLGACQGSTH